MRCLSGFVGAVHSASTSSISDVEEKKSNLILDYNSMKDAVDTIEMTTNTYSCHRQTRKYPTKLFTNILNVACWNIFVIWMMNNPEWNRGNLAKRRLFLKDFAETDEAPHSSTFAAAKTSSFCADYNVHGFLRRKASSRRWPVPCHSRQSS